MGGRFGNWLERRLGIWQLKRIAQSAAEDMGYKPRMHYDWTELEFHPDTRRIEEWLKQEGYIYQNK